MENGRTKMSNCLIDIILYSVGAFIGFIIYDIFFNNKNTNLTV